MDRTKSKATIIPDTPRPGQARRDLLLGLGAFVLFLIVSMGIVVALNPIGFRTLLTGDIQEPPGEQPIEITLMHTNDTWGYVDTCG